MTQAKKTEKPQILPIRKAATTSSHPSASGIKTFQPMSMSWS